MDAPWPRAEASTRLREATMQDLFAELAARSTNIHIDQQRANRRLASGGTEIYPCWHTVIIMTRDDPDAEIVTVDGHGNSPTGKLADWSKDHDEDADIDVSDRELRHGPPDV